MIKGYASSKKNEGSENAFPTIEPIREEQHGLSVLAHMTITAIASETAVSSSAGIIESTGTVAKKGDVIQVLTGPSADREIKVESVSGDFISLAEKVDIGVESFQILRHKYPRVDASGQLLSSTTLAPSAIKFNLDAVLTDVSEDTVTPLNSIPLPVKVVGATGLVPDFSTETTLAALLAELQLKADLTETQPVSIAGSVAVTGPLTDTQLRASSVPVSGPLTDGQLRASAVPVSAAALPLPTGAATEATLAALNGKVTAVDTGAVTVAASALPTGAATQTTLASVLASINLLAKLTDTQPVSIAGTVTVTGGLTDTQLRASPVPVSGPLTDTQLRATAVPVSGPLTDTQLRATAVPVSGTVAVTGVATETTLAALSAKFSALGQNTMANSAPVVLASNQSTLPTHEQGGDIADSAVKNSGTVTSGAWVQLIASTAAAAKKLLVFDSSGYSLELGVGAAASEVRKLIIPPGGLNGPIPLAIPAGSRISIRAINTTADYTAAEHLLTLLQ